MYLSPESLEVEIVSSKSSEMNVLVPKGNGDFVSISNLYNVSFNNKNIAPKKNIYI